jgi:hypothetical protein
MNRKQAKERLFLRLERLARYCKPSDTASPSAIWPDQGFLRDLESEVVFLVATVRKNPPSPAWKAFRLLDRRMPKLLLVRRVDNLVKRARDRLEEAAQHPLSKLEQQAEGGDENAQELLRDIAAIRDGQDGEKKIDWTAHEKALAQFSRTRSVEPAYGRSAPLGIRCYARALELIVDDCRRKPLESWPLTEWTVQIGHPDAKSLLAFDDPTEFILYEGAWRWKGAQCKRQKARERVQRCRQGKKERRLYPGDWIRFRDAADFRAFYGRKQPLPEACIGLEDSEVRDDLDAVLGTLACSSTLSGSKRPSRVTDEPDGFYYHRTRHVARCHDCQNAEWISQGFEVENGFPYGDWRLTTAERIAEQNRRAGEQLERDRRWLKTPQGQQWVRDANRRLVASLKERARQQGWTQEQLRAEAKVYGLIR